MPNISRRAEHLTRIAGALGCSPGDLLVGGALDARQARVNELLQLWDVIGDEAGWDKVLTCAREVAAERAQGEAVKQVAE